MRPGISEVSTRLQSWILGYGVSSSETRPRESNREGLIVHVGGDVPYPTLRLHYRTSVTGAFVKTAQITHVPNASRVRNSVARVATHHDFWYKPRPIIPEYP